MSQTKAELIKGLNINASAPATSLQIDASGNVNIDSNTLYVDATNNRVGIGTTNPVFPLHVETTGQVALRLRTTSSNTSNPSIQIVDPTSAKDGLFTYTSDGIAIGSYSAHPLSFIVQNSERARIDTSGRLLVGTSTARDKFFNAASGENPLVQFEGAGVTAQGLYMLSLTANNTSSSSGAGASLILARSGGTSVGSYTTVSDGQSLGRISFQGADGSELVEGASITALADGGVGANDLPTRLVFSTTADGASSPTIRTEIKANGAFRTVADSGIDVAYLTTPSAAGTSTAIIRGLRSGTAGTPGSGTDVFYVFSNGTVQNATGTYTTISDAKLKENIVDANSQWDDLKNIKIRNWNFKEETGQETHRQLGPIAQELEKVCPGLVFEVPDKDQDGNELGTTTKGVMQSVLYMKAVKALQEAMERIEQLEAEMAEVKAQLS